MLKQLKFISFSAFIRKGERSQINYLNFPLTKLIWKDKRNPSKQNKGYNEGIMKMGAEIKYIENRKVIEKIKDT